jgi:hypothetical protein
MGLCLLAGAVTVRLGAAALTLAWTHSVQKTRWEEDWQLQQGRLVVVESRVESTGAGRAPPPEARFDGHWWRWRPALPPQEKVVLRRSGATADWSVCMAGQCRLMGSLVPADADPVTLAPCP